MEEFRIKHNWPKRTFKSYQFNFTKNRVKFEKNRKTVNDMTSEEINLAMNCLKKRKRVLKSFPGCAICFDDEMSCPPIITVCKHIFCAQCALNLKKKYCPFCRKKLKTPGSIIICSLYDTVEDCYKRLKNAR